MTPVIVIITPGRVYVGPPIRPRLVASTATPAPVNPIRAIVNQGEAA